MMIVRAAIIALAGGVIFALQAIVLFADSMEFVQFGDLPLFEFLWGTLSNENPYWLHAVQAWFLYTIGLWVGFFCFIVADRMLARSDV